MKKLIGLVLAVISMAAARAVTGGSGEGYDPSNPPDPQVGYRLVVNASPAEGGRVSPDKPAYRQPGEAIFCYARPEMGYSFRAWMVGEDVISTSTDIYYNMPEENVTLTAWFEKEEYNPANPGDPAGDGYGHRVNVYVTPSSAGWVSNSSFELREGEEAYLYAYPYNGFRFSCWKQDGKIVSTERALLVKMGQSNMDYTAQFVYDPASPANPGANLWNPMTGEVVIDDFTPGSLWSTIAGLVGYDDLWRVTSLTVIGEISPWDFSLNGMENIVSADFSRTSGATYVPNWAFENHHSLTKIILPSSITEIYSYAFYNCPALSELICYATLPPTADEYSFYGVPSGMVVRVYTGSIELYKAARGWKDFFITNIDDESVVLMVELPDDAADGHYRNAALLLSNLSTGQSQKLVITANRVAYQFGNLIPDMKYSLYALSPDGEVIGRHLEFVVPKEGMVYKFESLISLHDVTLSVTSEDGKDLTSGTTIRWYDASGALLGSGATLASQTLGRELEYECTLSRDLGVEYSLPARAKWTVSEGSNNIILKLARLTTVPVEGKVTDALTGEGIPNAYVNVSQTLNGQYSVSSNTTTDATGTYKANVYDAPGSITVGSAEYVDKTAEYKNLAEAKNVASMALDLLSGAEIRLSLLARDNMPKGSTDNAFKDFEDYANVEFKVRNLTGNIDLDYRMRYPRIILLGEVKDGDRIAITATPAKKYNPETVETVISDGKGDVKITFTANGDLKASYEASDASEVMAIVYDVHGRLYKKETYSSKKVSFKNLPASEYTLVTMAAGRFYSGAATLAELTEAPLTAGEDYLIDKVKVEDGYITSVTNGNVPSYDESLFYYTGGETSVSVNKKNVVVGSIVTVRSKVDFLPQYADKIEKVNIIFSIPEGCEYVDNSLILGGNGANFSTVGDGVISVEVPVKDASPRFCIIPRKSGEYRPSAVIEFEYEGKMIRQPIGSMLFTASDFTLSAPEKTSIPTITVTGITLSMSEVKVYDNDMLMGSTRSLPNGDWRFKFNLFNPGDYSEHHIYAVITTPDGVKYTTSTAKTIYDKYFVELTDIDMVYGGMMADFNYIEATTSPSSYSYVPGNGMFTFKAVFREGQAENVKELDFIILLSDGSTRRVAGKYLTTTSTWTCALLFDDVNRLPVNVMAVYVEERDAENASLSSMTFDNLTFRCPDIIPIIDPSGYVYEAVESNRVEGVMATIYYRELVEDMYGDVVYREEKWDAESYAQENPIFTDEEGMYRWDVPQGEWQVRFEKNGYDNVSTEWLPVPPPQLDINVSMVSMVAPEVKSVAAYTSAIEIEFDKYMETATLNSGNIYVTVGGETVEGTLSLLDAEEGEGGEYATIVRFETETPFDGEAVTLMVSSNVRSYAGVRMQGSFVQEFDVEPEISEIIVPESITGYVGKESHVSVTFEPAEAAVGKTLVISLDSPILSVDRTAVVGENGVADVMFSGDLPGEALLTFSLEEHHGLKAQTRVILEVADKPAEKPVASIESGTRVEAGTTVELTSATEGATIWYTTDGTSPEGSATRMQYTEPIVIDRDMLVSAVAVAEGYIMSDIAYFEYTVSDDSGVADAVADGFRIVADKDGALRVAGIGNATCRVGVYTQNGVAIKLFGAIGENTPIDLGDVVPGVYIVRAEKDGVVRTMKFRKI